MVTADRAGLAVGWRTVPPGATSFEGDITLTAADERTVRVVDPSGRPMEGAKVIVYSLGDLSSRMPFFRDHTEQLAPDDGPLTAVTGPDGRAVFAQLPKTKAAFQATKPGFAPTYAFNDLAPIRLTPSASLCGTVTDPGGPARFAGIPGSSSTPNSCGTSPPP